MGGGGKIQANYDELAAAAQRFAQEAQQTQQSMQRISSIMDGLQGGGWIGRGANSFFSEMNDEVLPAIRRLSSALDEGSNTISRVSNMISQAEQDASSIFARRR